MHKLYIDIETYSDAPIGQVGAHRYVDDPTFEVILAAYAIDDGPVQVVDLLDNDHKDTAPRALPEDLLALLFDGGYDKYAYNAAFEFNALSKWCGRELVPSQWRCVMVHSFYAGYGGGLELAGRLLGIASDKQKLSTGKALIRYFCVPQKPTRTNGQRTRNYPWHDPAKWKLFKEYCAQDVEAERAIDRNLEAYPMPVWLQKQYETDLMINRRGVYVDMELVQGAQRIAALTREDLMAESRVLTGLENPNSIEQLRSWLAARTDENWNSICKDDIRKALARDDLLPEVRRVLELRQELGKTSNKKYDAIAACVRQDGTVGGLLQFYGAVRTGRYAGRLVQVQNLPRTYTKAIDAARYFVRTGNHRALRLFYPSINVTLSELIRTAFIAHPGNVLIDADFSAIEARVISWLAGEKWRLEVFKTHGKIYEASASQMFNVPIDRIKKGNPEYALRAKGKVAELALGYNGGAQALIAMGALDMGLHEEELPDIVHKWRTANPSIRQLWYDLDESARQVISYGGRERVKCLTLAREYDSNLDRSCLSITLPSGRKLYYVDPALGTNRFGSESIIYHGISQTTRQWTAQETYGGKLTENVVQAIARDLLAEAIERLTDAGFPIVFHIHDEVVIDIKPFDTPDNMLKSVTDIMSETPSWAAGLPLSADGWVGEYFTKD